MADLYIKTKLVCNISKLPIKLFVNGIDPLTYISDAIIQGKQYKDIWLEFKNHFLDISQIKSSAKLFQLDNDVLKKVPSSSIFHPWIHSKPSSQYHDVWLSIFTDEKKFLVSYKKIFNLIESIKKFGYDSNISDDRQGGIIGYFLSSKDKVCFYVNAGNHRVAVLKSLDFERFECNFQEYKKLKHRDIKETYLEKNENSYFVRDYNTQHASCWPAVKSGFLNEEAAILIADRYINGY